MWRRRAKGDAHAEGAPRKRTNRKRKSPPLPSRYLYRPHAGPFGDRPPLRRTITGGRPPGRRISRPQMGGLDDHTGKCGEMPSLPHCRAIRFERRGLSELESGLGAGLSSAPLNLRQNFFDQPTVAGVYVEAKRAGPAVGPFARRATATDNNFGIFARRAWKWLS